MSQLPNFLFIGPDKAGSTWLHRTLAKHPDVCVSPAKDIYFFDRNFHRGFQWYSRQFPNCGDSQVIADISHDYLYSSLARQRILESIPDTKLMVCLREPVDRAFSAYLNLRRVGLFNGTFEQALVALPNLVDHGYYFRHLEPYVRDFGRERIFVAIFDDLVADPNAFAARVFEFLKVMRKNLTPEERSRALPAARARSLVVARLVKRSAQIARRLGLSKTVGRVKANGLVHALLFKSYGKQRPTPPASSADMLRATFAPDIRELDRMLGLALAQRWGYGD